MTDDEQHHTDSVRMTTRTYQYVDDLEKYNEEEGLALSEDEMAYLHKLEKENGRPLHHSEIFAYINALPPQDLRRPVYRRQRTMLSTTNTTVQDSLCHKDNLPGPPPGSCYRAVCSSRSDYQRFLPGEGYRECHLAEG